MGAETTELTPVLGEDFLQRPGGFCEFAAGNAPNYGIVHGASSLTFEPYRGVRVVSTAELDRSAASILAYVARGNEVRVVSVSGVPLGVLRPQRDDEVLGVYEPPARIGGF